MIRYYLSGSGIYTPLTGSVVLAVETDLKGSFKGGIDIDVDVDIDRYLGCLKFRKGGFKVSSGTFHGLEAVLVLTLSILK